MNNCRVYTFSEVIYNPPQVFPKIDDDGSLQPIITDGVRISTFRQVPPGTNLVEISGRHIPSWTYADDNLTPINPLTPTITDTVYVMIYDGYEDLGRVIDYINNHHNI